MMASSTKLSFILGLCPIQKINHWNMENILLTALRTRLAVRTQIFSIFTINGDTRLQTDDYLNQKAIDIFVQL